MRDKKYYLYLTAEEQQEIIQSLIEKKNKLIQEGRYTDAIDDVLYKVIKAKRKKLRIKEK